MEQQRASKTSKSCRYLKSARRKASETLEEQIYPVAKAFDKLSPSFNPVKRTPRRTRHLQHLPFPNSSPAKFTNYIRETQTRRAESNKREFTVHGTEISLRVCLRCQLVKLNGEPEETRGWPILRCLGRFTLGYTISLLFLVPASAKRGLPLVRATSGILISSPLRSMYSFASLFCGLCSDSLYCELY